MTNLDIFHLTHTIEMCVDKMIKYTAALFYSQFLSIVYMQTEENVSLQIEPFS